MEYKDREFLKIDYLIGPFLLTLISRKILPTVEKGTKSSRIIRFNYKNVNYISYFKFACSKSGSEDITWPFSYSNNDMELIKKLQNEVTSDEKLLFVNLCKAKETDTTIAILSASQFKKALGIKNFGGKQDLKIKRESGSNKLHCYKDEGEEIIIPRFVDVFFDN